MPTISSSLSTDFTPAVGDFIVQVTGGSVDLVRKNTSGAAYTLCGRVTQGAALIVSNPVPGAVYQAVRVDGAPVFQADQ